MQIGISTGDTHGISHADSTAGHADTLPGRTRWRRNPDASTTSPKDPSFEEALGSADEQPHSGRPAADTPATHADEATDTTQAGRGSGDAHDSGKVNADAQRGHDSAEHADADPKAKDHSANGKADDTADSARHDDKTEADKAEAEADKPTSDKSHEEDDAAHHDDAEHPKDTDDTHKSDQDEKYEDLYDHSHDKDGPDSSYNPETDPHSKPDPNYDSLPDSSINQSESFPEGVDPYRTPPKTRRQLEEALEAWESYQKKVLSDEAE